LSWPTFDLRNDLKTPGSWYARFTRAFYHYVTSYGNVQGKVDAREEGERPRLAENRVRNFLYTSIIPNDENADPVPEEFEIMDLSLADWKCRFAVMNDRSKPEEAKDDASDECDGKDGSSEVASPDVNILDHDPWSDEIPRDVVERVESDVKAAQEADKELMKNILPEVSSHGFPPLI
jgi:hypothetical protein